MTKIIKSKFDKAELPNMPRATFKGRIVVVISEKEADAAVEYLLQHKILGIDSETKPSFKKGRNYQVALLQVSTHDTCFLFRLNRIGLTDSLVRLLQDCSSVKIGLSLHDDLHMLHQRRDFTPGRFIDIQNEVKKIGIEDLSLQKIYGNIFKEKISKNQQLSNWEADSLTEAQQHYAALDAQACIRIYEEVARLVETGDYTLEKVPVPQPVNMALPPQ